MRLSGLISRLSGFLRRQRVESELTEEIEAHLESLERDNLRSGMSPDEARAAARRSFGPIEVMKEEHRDQRVLHGAVSLLQDWRYAVRAALRSRAHSALVIGTFAIGIAGSSAVFSVYDRMFIRPLPFAEADRLVHLDEGAEDMPSIRLAYANFLAWREESRTLESLAAWAEAGYNLSFDDDSERITGARVTHDLDNVLRVTPILGRTILPDENVENGPKSAVLGYGLWQRRFGGLPDVLGQRIRLNDESYTIVGVLPNSALLPGAAEVWTPLQESPQYGVGWFLLGVGRLADGESLLTARAELERIQVGLAESRGDQFATFPVLTELREHHLGSLRNGGTLVLAAVGVVLLIACGNAAGLMLVAAARRRPELATRLALGASRGRVIRQLTAETVYLSLLGGLVGVAGGYAALRSMSAFRPEEFPAWLRFEMDGRFVLFTITLALVSGLIVGLLSSYRATRAADISALRGSAAKGSSARGDRRSLDALVLAQSGLALSVLMVAGLLFQALEKVRSVKSGFDTDDRLTFTLSLPRARYPDGGSRVAFFQSLIDLSDTLPDVRAIGGASLPPLQGYSATTFVTNTPTGPSDQPEPPVLLQSVIGEYFGAAGIELIDGRLLDSRDRPDARPTIVVNESFARHYFGAESPVGRRVRYRNFPDSWMTIVGVSADVRHDGLEREAPLAAYIPLAQNADAYSTMTFVAQGAAGARSLAPPLLRTVKNLDPGIPAYALMNMEERLGRAMLIRRAYTWLASAFAALALLLTVAGFYGVTSYLVRQRRREIGIRMALGEQSRAVQRRIVGRALSLAAVGAVIGLATGGYAALLLDSLLLGLPPWTARPILAAAALVFSVVFLASWFPASRASRANPRELMASE